MNESIRSLPRGALIGMVHLTPLPGSPGSCWPLGRVIDLACGDAAVLAEAGFSDSEMDEILAR